MAETTPRSDSSQSRLYLALMSPVTSDRPLASRTPSEPTAHAETQTQIRGITVQSALWENSRTASTDSAVSDISVATISRLLEQMEGGGEGGGLVTVPAVIFFTESDNTNNRNKRLVPSPLLPPPPGLTGDISGRSPPVRGPPWPSLSSSATCRVRTAAARPTLGRTRASPPQLQSSTSKL